MPHETKPNVVSMGGSRIIRHAQAAPWHPPQAEMCLEQISAHVERHLGKIETVFHEVASDTVHIDVHIVPPAAAFPYARLVTSGMSDLPMRTPAEADVPRYTELLVTLPADWRLDQASFEDETWYWPMRLIKSLARLPHKYGTWLGWGHTVPNGDPAQPYAPGTALNGSIVLPSITVPDEFHRLRIDQDKEIAFFAVVPLYEEEMNLKLRSGTDALLDRLSRHDLSDIVDPRRPNVAKKRFGLF